MPRIGKEFTFEAAHRLQNHEGQCYNLHGHSYRVFVDIEGIEVQTEGAAKGMLFDFGVLSEWWRPIEASLDHKTILEAGDPLIDRLTDYVVMFVVDWTPTAENIAEWIRANLWQWLHETVGNFVVRVRVYETAKSWAEA